MPRNESRTLTLALDEQTVLLAAEALRGEADRRRRAGVKMSAELMEAKRTEGTDIRSGGVQVVNILADADSLAGAAEMLTAAWDAGKLPKVPAKRRSSTPEPAPPEASPGDDDDELDDGDDDLEPTVAPDGSTSITHVDDPDVAAAREALGLELDPAVAPVPGTSTPPSLP